MNDEQEAVEALLEHMVGRVIVDAGIEDDEFIIVLDDNTKVVLFSDEDLQLYYEFGETLDSVH
jgi:hypothetical protein